MLRHAPHISDAFVHEFASQIMEAYSDLDDAKVETTVDGHDAHLDEITHQAKQLGMQRNALRDRIVREVRARVKERAPND